ncbi:MAG: HAMP domain-containing protein, partial [Nitrospinae bacterium]|nr:HAMP domain-containing protein [Nitrospinota bacterium]
IRVAFIGVEDRGREIVRVNRKETSIQTVPPDQLQSKEHRRYFQDAIKSGKGEVLLSEVNLRQEQGRITEPHTPVMRAAVPVFTAEGKVFGIIKITLNIEPIFQSLHHSKDDEHLHYVTNEKGDFLVHPDNSMVFGFDLGKRHTIQKLFSELTPLFAPGNGTDTLSTFSGRGDDRQLVSLHKIHFDPLRPERFLGITQSVLYSHVVAESIEIRNRGMRFTLVIAAVGLVVVLFFSRRITRPLRRITRSADEISAGATNVPLPIDSGDEIGSLARSFATMVAKLKAGREALQEAHDRLEVRVQERTAELKRSNQELENFAYIASHDLQEPLRKIITFGDRLKELATGLNPQGKDYLDRMQNASLRMQDFIHDLLDYSRVTSQTKNFGPTDLAKVVQEVLDHLEHKIARTKGAVHIDSLPCLEADPRQMRQLFQNLIGNALKYHREDVTPVVRLSSSKNGDGLWEIRVQDNGIGFDEKYAERIFKLFERLHGRSAYRGTGIGLAICQKIAHNHHGNITATSKPGEGSTFIVTLPEKQP